MPRGDGIEHYQLSDRDDDDDDLGYGGGGGSSYDDDDDEEGGSWGMAKHHADDLWDSAEEMDEDEEGGEGEVEGAEDVDEDMTKPNCRLAANGDGVSVCTT